MAVGLALGPSIAAVRDVRALLRAENVVALGPAFWLLLDLIQGLYSLEGLTQAHVRVAFAAIGLFALGVWTASLHKQWRFPRLVNLAVHDELRPQTYFILGLIAFAIAFCRFAIPCDFDLMEMVRYLGAGRWAAPWSRGQEGGWNAFLDHLSYFGYVLPMLTVVLATRTRWSDPRTIILAVLSVLIAAFLAQGGGRRIIGVIFGSAVVYWVLTHRKIRWLHLAAASISLVFLLVFLQAMLDYRNEGLRGLVGQSSEGQVERSEKFRVDDNFIRLAQIVSIIPEEHPYVYGRYLVWVLVRPVPRVLWPGKPVDPGFDLPTHLGVAGVSYSCSVIGELYMAGGLVAVLLGGWLYGRLAGTASRLLSVGIEGGSLIPYSAFLLALFAGMRSGIELVLMSYVVLVWLALSWAARRFAGGHTQVRPRKLKRGQMCPLSNPTRHQASPK